MSADDMYGIFGNSPPLSEEEIAKIAGQIYDDDDTWILPETLEYRKREGLCPTCGEKGPFINSGMVCSKHGPY